MANVDVDLAGLNDDELLHIKEVLSRDKKLRESHILLSPTMNNNTDIRGKQNPSTNDLVMAEIDRVHRLTPISDRSERNTPISSDHESSAEDGFFVSFAQMISRSVGALSGNKKGQNASADEKKMNEEKPKTPFAYNPRETVRKKPTLLELAKSRRSSSPATPTGTQHYLTEALDENTFRRRGNAMFASLPAANTIPRNYKTNATPLALPLTPIRSRSPSMNAVTNVRKEIPKSLGNRRRSPPTRPKVLISAASEDRVSPVKSPKRKTSHSSGSSTHSSPGKRSLNSPMSPRKVHYEQTPKNASPVHSSPEKDYGTPLTIMEDRNNRRPCPPSQSHDSGIYSSRPEFFMRKYDNESPLEDDNEMGQLTCYNYEPDTESVCESDAKPFVDYADDISLTSASSSFYGSPMKRFHGDFVQDSWDESDTSSGVFVNPKLAAGDQRRRGSPGSQEPVWMKTKFRNLTESANGFSPISSPSLSNRSIPTSETSSPAKRKEAPSSPIDSIDTIGNVEISLIYYSAETFKRKNRARTEIPSYGTKSLTEKKCHVLSRREYAEVTNADLEVRPDTKSGAPESLDGELHVSIIGAKFQDTHGKIKSPNTYVKCYLLPDKFHNSKMKSAVVKKCKEPKWDHKFILAGFSQSELRERSLEIIVGSWHFKKQEVLGGVTLSVSQCSRELPGLKSTKAESYVWKTALQISGNKVKTLLPLRAHMKPNYM